MNGIEKLLKLIEERISALNQEKKNMTIKEELINMKIDVSKTLASDYHNIVKCRDSDILKLIDTKLIEFDYQEYLTIKFIIANEDEFTKTGFEIPQYSKAIEKVKEFVQMINKKIEYEKQILESYNATKKQYNIKLEKFKNIITAIKDKKEPILDIEFILTFLASSDLETDEKTEILSSITEYNNRIYKDKEVTSSKKITEMSSTEDEKEEVVGDYSFENEEALVKAAKDIIDKNQYIFLKGCVEQLKKTLIKIDACNDLLKEEPNDTEFKEEKKKYLDELEDAISNYQTCLIYVPKEESTIDKTKLMPGEQYRILYFMDSKSIKRITPEDLLDDSLVSFFEEDFVSEKNVNNYKIIDKLLTELRTGILYKMGEHNLRDALGNPKFFLKADKGGQKPRICVRQVNDDTVLVFGYANKDGNRKSNNISYATPWENRLNLYGPLVEEFIDKINTDPKFRSKAYYIGRIVDDRVKDILINKRTNVPIR